MKKFLYVISLIPLLALTSCDGSLFYADHHDVDPHGWNPADTVAFDVEVTDTAKIYNFLVELRNTTDYPYANTFFFIRTTFPDGSVAQDTLECPLADPEGKWYGKHTGRYVDSRYYFRRNARFPMEGTYRFAFTNGMRDSAVVGLKDVGLRIEYSKMR